MFKSLFKKKVQEKKVTVVGQETELVHDITIYQYGTVFIDGVRYSVRSADGTEMCKGTKVKVVEEKDGNGTVVLTVRKV